MNRLRTFVCWVALAALVMPVGFAADEALSEPAEAASVDGGTEAPTATAPGKIAVGDLLFVDVYRHPELSTTIQVDPHGNIALAYAGSVSLVGLTENEASARVSMELTKILKNPRVTVSHSADALRGGARTTKMVLEMIPLHNGNAAAISGILQGMSSEGGSISADPDTNTVIITDTPDTIKNMQSVIARLDEMKSQLTQVRIEAKIAEVRAGAMKELGIRWFAQGDKTSGGYYPLQAQDAGINALRGPTSSTVNEQVGGAGVGNNTNGLGRRYVNEPRFDRRLNVPVQIPTVGQLFLGYFNKGIDVGAMLDALVDNKQAQMLANPMILTVNHKAADIEMVDEYPYVNLSTDVSGRSNYITRFMDVGIKLAVTPHVLKDEGGAYVKLEMEPEVSFPIGSSNGTPIRSVRRSHSVANVRSGQTLVIGGIFRNDDQSNESRVPGLGKVPILSAFFKHTEKTKTRTELMVFVTPTVHDTPEDVTWDRMINIDEANLTKSSPSPAAAAQTRTESRKD